MTKRDKNDPAEIERQRAITRRQEQRSARGMDANTAAFMAAWEDENDTAPVDIQIQEPTAPTTGQLIDEQRGTTPVSADSQVQFVNPSDLDQMRNRDRIVGNFKVAPGGAPLADRFAAGIKKTELGQYNYLVSRFGEENVNEVYGNDGKSVVGFRWRAAPDQPWRMVDPAPGADRYRGGEDRGRWRSMLDDIPGDIADVAGPMLLEAGPGAVLSGAGGAIAGPGGAVVGGMVGDAAGTVARDAVADRIPGKEAPDSPYAQPRDAAINVAAGMASNAIPMLGRYAVTPTRAIAGRVAKESVFDPLKDAAIREGIEDAAGATDDAARLASASAKRPVGEIMPERAALAQRTNVDLSAGQLTGSRSMLQKEDALASVEKYADQIGDAQMKRVRQGELFLRKTLDVAGGGKRADSFDAGTASAAAYANHTKNLDKARRLATKPLFAEANTLPGGDALPLDNFLAKINDRIAKEPRGSTSGTRAIYNDLKRIAKEYEGRPTASADELSSLLSDWGKAARGESLEAFKEADPRRARAMAAELFRALQSDLDGAAKAGTPAAQKLAQARDTFRELSKPIADADSALLRGFVKMDEAGAADTIGATLMRSKSPAQIQKAMRIMAQANPEAARSLFSDALGSIVDAAKAGTGEANQAGVSVSMARFATAGRANRGKVLALASGLGDTKEAKQVLGMWNDAVRVAEVITDRGLPPGSPTATRLLNVGDEAAGVLKDAKTGGIGGAAAGVIERAITKTPRLNGQKLAGIASDPEQRDAFTKLVQQMSTAGGRLKAEAASPRAYAEAWFRAAVQTGIIEVRDSKTGGLTAEQIQEERRRNRPIPVKPNAVAGEPYP